MKINKHSNHTPLTLKELGRRALVVLLTLSMVSMNSPLAYAAELGEPTEGTTTQSAAPSDPQEHVTSASDAQKTEAPAEDLPAAERQEEQVVPSENQEKDAGSVVEQPDERTTGTLQTVDVITEDSSDVEAEETVIALALDNAYIHYLNQIIAPPTDTLAVRTGQEIVFAASPNQGYELHEVKALYQGSEVVLEPDDQGLYTVPAQMVQTGMKLIVAATGNATEDGDVAIPIDEERNTQSTFEYEDAEVKVTATIDDPSVLPAHVQFKVTRILPNATDYNYDAYMEALNNKAKDEATQDKKPFVYDDQNTMLYDTAFMDGDVEVKLDSTQVRFTFEFKKNQLADKFDAERGDKIDLLHLPLVDAVRDSVDSTADATGITADDVKVEDVIAPRVDAEGDTTSFALNSLSTHAVVLEKGNQQTAQPKPVSATVKLYDTDGTTPYPLHNHEHTYYIRVKAKDAEGQEYYALKEIDLRDRSEASATIDYIAKTDEELVFGETPDSIALTTDYTIEEVRLVNNSSGEITSYEGALAANDKVQGFEFTGTDSNDDKTQNTITLNRLAHEKAYGIRLHFDTNNISVAENDGYAVLATVTHHSQDKTYYFQKLSFTSDQLTGLSDGTYAYNIPVNKFTDQNGADKDGFTGNEVGIEVRIVQVFEGAGRNEVLTGQKSLKLNTDAGFKNYVIRGFERIVESSDNGSKDTTYDTINLSELHATNDYNYQSVLGAAINYGITANHVTQANDLQTTFATNLFSNTGHSITPNLAAHAGTFVFADAEWKDNRWVIDFASPQDKQGKINLIWGEDKKPSQADANTPLKDNGDWGYTTLIGMQSTDIKNTIVNPMITYCTTKSQELASHASTIPTPSVFSGKSVLDVSGFAGDATIYVDADNYINEISEGQLLIVKAKNQTIVFNFDDTENLQIQRIRIRYKGESNEHSSAGDKNPGGSNVTLDGDAKHLIWNCRSVKQLNIKEGVGIFLVPKTDSTTTINATSSGWVVSGGHFINPNGEWHGIYADLPDNDTATLHAFKTVDGSAAQGNQKFVFKFEKYDGNGQYSAAKTAESDGSAVSININTFSKGWNVYRIAEAGKAETTQGEYEFDSNVYYAAIKYEQRNLGGDKGSVFIASQPRYFKTFHEDQFSASAADATAFMEEPVSGGIPTFANTSKTSSLTIKKTVANQPANMVNDTFEFDVFLRENNKKVNGTFDAKVYTGQDAAAEQRTVTFTDGKTTVSLKGNQNMVISGLRVGMQYEVKEHRPANAAWTNTSATNAKGSLTTDSSAPVAEFENEYDTTIDLETTEHVRASKQMRNNYWGGAHSFTFTLTAVEDEAPMPQGAQTVDGKQVVTMTANKGESGAPVAIDFGEITYTAPGIYHYEIREKNDGVSYVVYDDSVYTATVNVEQVGNELVATTTYAKNNTTVQDNKATFTNEYTVDNGIDVQFEAKKMLEGKNLEEGAYTFVLQSTPGTPSVTQTKTNGAKSQSNNAAPVTFDSIHYTLDNLSRTDQTTGLKYDVFTYDIYEQQGSDSDVLFDASHYTASVTVYDNGDGTLRKSEPVYKLNNQVKAEALFVNRTFEDSVTFGGNKTITGRSFHGARGGDQDADSFTFSAEAVEVGAGGTKTPISADSYLVPDDVTITPTSGVTASFEFAPVTYSHKDVGHTYEYTIREVAPDNKREKDHLAYSDAAYTVTVRVAMGKDEAGNDKLQITTTGNPTNLSFTNAYSGSASVTLQAQKTLNGTNPGNATYTFELWRAERNVNGNEVTFSKIGNQPIATTTNQGQNVTFKDIPELSYTEETLHTSDGFFQDSGYSQSRQLYYIITETPGTNTDYVTYDASEKHYTVVVSSALEADGNLRAYVLEEGEQYTSQDKTFANTQVEGASVQFKAHKTMKNANLSDFDPFTIELYEVKDGDTKIQSKTTDTNGYVDFDAITYKKADVGTHVYKIKEKSEDGRKDYITFDDHTETVRVKVSEDATSHKLIAQIVDDKGQPLVDKEGEPVVSPYMVAFENTYKASVDINLDATKAFKYFDKDGADKQFDDDDFSFVLTGYGMDADGETQGTTGGVATFGKRTITMQDMFDATRGTYLSQKTFTYTITETVPEDAVNANGKKYGELEGDARHTTFAIDGITYTGVPKTISVTVTDDHQGHLRATYNGGAYQSPSFTNTYNATGEYAFEATKLLDGTPYADQQGSSKFSFSLYRGTDAQGEPIQTVTTVGQNGTISFAPVKFSLAELKNADGSITPKTFDFTIAENNTGSAHYNYDTAKKHVKLTVSDGGNGKLRFELADDSDQATFANTTRNVADGEVQFVANKLLNGNPSGKAFTFYLEQKQADNTYAKIQEKTSQTDGEQKGIATFDKITYNLDQVGDYEYRIHEFVPEGAEPVGETDQYLLEGITYDGKNVDIVVHVRDNKNTNKLDVTYQVNGAAETEQLPAITFNNTYSATSVFTINATKTLAGRAFHGADAQKGLVADRIEFAVTGAELDEAGNEVANAVVPMPAKATEVIAPTSGTTAPVDFGAIHYTQDNAGKRYRYTVTETVSSGDNVSTRTTDENGVVRQLRHYVDVQVTDDEKGNLTVTPTYFNEGDEGNTSALAFYNDYDATGKLELEGKKTIEGRPMKDDDVYTFQVEERDEMGNPTGRSWTAMNADASGKATERIAFEDITYGLRDKDKTYSYTVTEVAQNSNGMSLKTPTDGYTFSVTITDNGDGTLNVTQPEQAKKLDFVNEYTVTGADYQFHGRKELNGRALKDEDVFTFNVAQYNGTVQDDGSVVYGTEAAQSWEVTNEDPQTHKATSTINFPTFSFVKNNERDDTGIKKYVISEASLNQDSPITAKTEPYTVELKVYDDGMGKLKVDELSNDLPDSFDFVNEYQASREVTFGGVKVIEGRQFMTGDRFDFEVLSADGVTASGEKVANVAVPNAVTIRPQSDSEAQVQFQTSYGLEDVGNTYTYTFHEKSYGLEDENYIPGITYDTTMYQASFTVVKDNGDGTLEVTGPVYKNAAGTAEIPSADVKFTNSYQAKHTSYVLEGRKTLSVASNLSADQGAPTLTRGAFKFELRNAAGAKLQEVKNGYKINADGSQTEVDPGTFAFKPIEASVASNAPGITYSIVEVIDNQAVNADGVTYENAKAAAEAANDEVTGTFTLDGLTYDTTVHYARVIVTDDFAGTLTPSVVYDNGQNDAPNGENLTPTFNNSIFRAQAHVEFDKYYLGNNNQNEQFSFSMIPASVDEAGNYVEKSGVPGITLTQGQFDENHIARVVSDNITYTQPGDYYYVVREQPVDKDRKVSTDDAKILVHITVAQDENDKQKVNTDVDYAMSFDNQVVPVIGENERPLLYNNGRVSLTYRSAALRMTAASEHAASFEPAVRKVLQSGKLKGGEFEFSIYAGSEVSGDALETVTNDANGMVKFNPMQFGTSDIGPHEYTIVERAGNDEAILYDKDPIKLTVTVSEGEGGEIVASGVYKDKNDEGQYVETDDPTFVNAYDSIVIHTVKRSREEPYDPLPGAHYGLWMVNPDGPDIYMGLGRNQQQREGSELVSSDSGDLYYDIPMLEGVAYYFLEEWPPPAGHLVDPYPTDLFTLVHDKTGNFRLVYELDDDFATYCPGVTYDMADGGKA